MWANKSVIQHFILLLLILLLSACGGSSKTTPKTTPTADLDPGVSITSVQIITSSDQLTTQGTSALSLTATLSDGTAKIIEADIVWSSSNPDVAIVSPAGLLQAKKYVDTVTINAEYQTFQASFAFNIKPSKNALIESFVFPDNSTGDNFSTNDKISVRVRYSDGSINESMDFIVDAVSIDGTGSTVLEVSNTQAKFKAVVAGAGIANVSLLDTLISIDRVEILASSATLQSDAFLTVSALAIFTDNSSTDITNDVIWLSDNAASLAYIPGTNTFKANNVPGNANITADHEGVVSNILPITVTVPDANTPTPVVDIVLNTISITASSLEINENETITFTAEGNYSDQTIKNITDSVIWLSDDNGVLKSTNNNNIFTGVAPGSTKINVSLGTISSFISASVVKQPPVTTKVLVELILEPDQSEIIEGESETYKLFGKYSDNPDISVPINSNITWSYTDSSGAVTQNTTANFQLNKAGNYVVTATYEDKNVTAALNVNSPPIGPNGESIQILINSPDLISNTPNYNIIARLNYSDNSSETVTSQVIWSTENNEMLEVADGNIKTKNLLGSTRITAYLAALDLTATIDVTVSANPNATINGIEITESSFSMFTNATHVLKANVLYSDGSVAAIDSGISWKSLDEEVATIDDNGIVNSLSISTSVLISASFTTIEGDFFANITINVTDENSYDFVRFKVGETLSKTHIEDLSDFSIRPIISAFNNPVGLLTDLRIPNPFSGFYITLNAPVTQQTLALAIQSPSLATFDKTSAIAVFKDSSGDNFALDSTDATSVNITLEKLGVVSQNNIGSFSAVLCKQTVIDNAGDCGVPTNQINISGSFATKTEIDSQFQSHQQANPVKIETLLPGEFHQISENTSYYSLLTTIGSQYEIRALSDNASVSFSVFSSILDKANLGNSSTNSAISEQSLIFTAESKISNVEFYFGGASGTTFQIFDRALAATAQGNASSPLPLNSGKVFFSRPGQVDNTSSYYEVITKPGYAYRVTIETDTTESASESISALSFKTSANDAYQSCELSNLRYICTVLDNTGSIFLKVDGPTTTSNSFSKFKITAEYNPVRDPNNENEALLVQLADVQNLTGQVTFGSQGTVSDFNGAGSSFGSGASVYWVEGLKPDTFYKIRLYGLEDGTRLWVNGSVDISSPKCSPAGNGVISDIYCIVKTGRFNVQGLSLYVDNSPASIGTVGSTYALDMAEVSESDLFYFSTFGNASTQGCTNFCELLGYSMYLENAEVPFAVSITTPDQFHSKLLHLNSGDTIYIRINDVRNKGNTYSMTMRKDNVSRRSIREVANPDPAELNNDDLKQNATLLSLDAILNHSLSNNNGTYGDVDWFVFTAP